MTRDDILSMAKEAGLTQKPFCRWGGYADDLMRFAALVAEREREACVIACEKISESLYSYDNIAEGRAAQDCAKAIRARGET